MRSVILISSLLLIAAAPAGGQDCDDYTQYLRWIASAGFPGMAGSVAVSGNFAYVANQDYYTVGMQVFDISDPHDPALRGWTPGPGQKFDVAVAGPHACLTSAAGLEVIDVSDPDHLSVLGSVGTLDTAWRVAVQNKHAYVAAWDSGLVVVDVSVASQPTVVGLLDFPEEVRDVAVQGHYAYLANFRDVRVVDIVDPTAPVLVGTYSFDVGYSTCLDIAGEHLYVGNVSTSRGLHVFDVSDPTAPTLVGSSLDFTSYDVTVDGQEVFVCSGGGLKVFDVSDPATPTLTGQVTISSEFVAVAGDHAYVGSGSTLWPDLLVVELGLRSSPDPLASDTELDYVYHVATEPGLAYALGTIGTNSWNLRSLDVATPSSPQLLDSLSFGHGVHIQAIDVDGGLLAFMLDDDLRIIDVSDPADMSVASTTFVDDWVTGIALEGSLLHVARTWGLSIYDVSTPAMPVLVGELEFYYPTDIDVVGSLAYLTGSPHGLQMVDVSDPAAPMLLGELPGTYNDFDVVTVTGDYAYLGGYYEFAVIDVSSPQWPQILERMALPGEPLGIAEENGTVSVAILGGQVQLYDVSYPFEPTILGNTGATYPSRAWDVAMEDGVIFVGASGAGMTIYLGQCGTTAVGDEIPGAAGAMLAAWPNPFNPRTYLAFTLERTGPADLAIYDLAGRRVRRLRSGSLPAGEHAVMWDGRDEAGRHLPAGVFFARLTTPLGEATRKLVLIK